MRELQNDNEVGRNKNKQRCDEFAVGGKDAPRFAVQRLFLHVP